CCGWIPDKAPFPALPIPRGVLQASMINASTMAFPFLIVLIPARGAGTSGIAGSSGLSGGLNRNRSMSMRKIGRADSAGRIVPRVTEVQDAEQLHCVFEEILIHALGGRHAPCGFAAGDRPAKPQTQGKIERWHQILKNRILLYNYYLPGNLERQISAFV